MTKSILLVEDDKNLQEMLNEYLTSSGYCVVTANNAQEGLELFSKKGTDFVITDLNMPGPINGVDVARRIKAYKPNTKILICTGYTNQLERVENIAHLVIKKPFDLNQVTSFLEKWLREGVDEKPTNQNKKGDH